MTQPQGQEEEWVMLTEAATDVNVSVSKLSRLVNQKKLASIKDNRDMRVTLVNLNQVRAMFPPSKRRR